MLPYGLLLEETLSFFSPAPIKDLQIHLAQVLQKQPAPSLLSSTEKGGQGGGGKNGRDLFKQSISLAIFKETWSLLFFFNHY